MKECNKKDYSYLHIVFYGYGFDVLDNNDFDIFSFDIMKQGETDLKRLILSLPPALNIKEVVNNILNSYNDCVLWYTKQLRRKLQPQQIGVFITSNYKQIKIFKPNFKENQSYYGEAYL